MSQQLYSSNIDNGKLYPFRASLLPSVGDTHSLGNAANRWDVVHCQDCQAGSVTTPEHIVDDILMDIANKDIKISRDSVSHVLIDNNAGGPAILQVAKYEVGDTDFNLELDGTDSFINFAGGDFIKYDRTLNQMEFKIGAAPNPDVVISNGKVLVDDQLCIADFDTFIHKDTTGPTNGDVFFVFNDTDTDQLVWDDSTNELSFQVAGSPIVNMTPTSLEVDTINPVTGGAPVVVAGVDIQLINTRNILVGNGSLAALTTGDENTALGDSALALLETGIDHVAIGNNASAAIVGNSCTVAIGFNTLAANTVSDNVAIGCSAMLNNTTGANNTAVGRSSLRANIIGNNNTALGHMTLNASLATGNTAIGKVSLELATSGGDNTAVGCASGNTVTIGTNNTFLGSGADTSAAGAIEQMGLGYLAIPNNSLGSIQLGQSGTATSTGFLKYREQTIMSEGFKSTTLHPIYSDTNGNFIEGVGTSGDVVQATNIGTTVVIASTVFTILTQSSSLGAELSQSFTVTNSEYVAGTGADVIQVTLYGYSGTYATNGLPVVNVSNALSNGTFDIQISNAHSGNALSGTLRIGVHIIKA